MDSLQLRTQYPNMPTQHVTTPDPIVSAVVCTRNRGSRIVGTLESLLANTHPNFEVVVVDQSTNGETETAVAPFRTDPRLRYIASDTVGTGYARDIGLAAARGGIVAYTDDDCIVPTDWLAQMQAIFESHPRVAVVFCNVEAAPYDETVGFTPTYERTGDKLVRNMWDKCRARGIGAGMAVRRSPIMQLGGFDHLLGPGTAFSDCEDGDIAMRTLLADWWLYETSQTAVIHDGFRTWEEGKAMTRRNWTGIGAAYAKPIKAGRWSAGIVVAYEVFGMALLKPLSRLLRLQRPQGIRSFGFFWRGFVSGMRHPVDDVHLLFGESAREQSEMIEKNPKVTIGIPVYNGENFLADAIEAVLAQTYQHFEIVISDNASTDRTREICEAYAARDGRIRYVRTAQNQGAAWNFNRVFELATGKYFKWLAHDDLIDPTFVEKAVNLLERDETAVLAYARTDVIDEAGSLIEHYDVRLDIDNPDVAARFRSLVLEWHLCFEVFGLIRRDVMAQTPVMGNYGHGDGVLLARLGLRGRFLEIPEPLLLSRRHGQQSMREFGYLSGGNNYHAYTVWFDPSKANQILLPNWRILGEYYKSIWQTRLSLGDRLKSHVVLLRWMRRDGRHLLNDLNIAARQAVGRLRSAPTPHEEDKTIAGEPTA